MSLQQEMDRFYVASLVSDLRVSREADSEGMSLQEMMYCDLIRYMEDCTVGILASLLGVDKSTVSKRVDALVAKGAVTKVRDPEDGRVHHLVLTREASEFYDRYDAPYDRAAEALRGEFSDEEIEVVCRVLRRMSRSLMEGDHAQR